MPLGSNKPFGIKAGRGQPSVMVRRREETNVERSVYINAPFREFPSLTEAFDQHGKLLATHPAYSLARQHTNDPDAYADALTHHYATDPHQGHLFKSIMRSRKIYQFNQGLPPRRQESAVKHFDRFSTTGLQRAAAAFGQLSSKITNWSPRQIVLLQKSVEPPSPPEKTAHPGRATRQPTSPTADQVTWTKIDERLIG